MSSELTVATEKKLTKSQQAKAKAIERQKVALPDQDPIQTIQLNIPPETLQELINNALQTEDLEVAEEAKQTIKGESELLLAFINQAKENQNQKRIYNDEQYEKLVQLAQECGQILNNSVQSWNDLQRDLKAQQDKMLKDARADIMSYFYETEESGPND